MSRHAECTEATFKALRQSVVMCVWLTDGYFAYHATRGELREALNISMPILILHESDLQRGGAPLLALHSACPSELRADLFGAASLFLPRVDEPAYMLITYKHVLAIVLQASCVLNFEQDLLAREAQRRSRLRNIEQEEKAAIEQSAQGDEYTRTLAKVRLRELKREKGHRIKLAEEARTERMSFIQRSSIRRPSAVDIEADKRLFSWF